MFKKIEELIEKVAEEAKKDPNYEKDISRSKEVESALDQLPKDMSPEEVAACFANITDRYKGNSIESIVIPYVMALNLSVFLGHPESMGRLDVEIEVSNKPGHGSLGISYEKPKDEKPN
jgi:hypothetical protein